jgi:hypothetical protein
MSAELYEFDESLGLWGFVNDKDLATCAINNVVRYEQGLAKIEPLMPASPDEYRGILSELGLSTLVMEDEQMAYALALTASGETNRRGTEGICYTIDLGRSKSLDDEPEVVKSKSIFITHSSLLESSRDYETEVAELTHRFSKSELEAIMRMSGKLATSLEVATELPKQVISRTFSHRAALNRAATIEPRVLYALKQYHLDDLGTFFPGRRSEEVAADESPEEIVHILEWNKFLSLAKDLFRRESDDAQAKTSIALQHVIDTNHYLIKIEAAHGELTQIKLLCYDDAGTLQKKKYDLRSVSDEDDMDRLRIGSHWNRAELLECLREGTPISEKMYRSYLELEKLELEESASEDPASKVTDIRSRKRPAA